MRSPALFVCALVLFPLVALAQTPPPSLMQLQGRLTDSVGQPITSTQRDLRVEFWTLGVGGVSLGTSTVVDPAIANGIYAVTVTAPAGVFAGNAIVFMEMAVGNGAAGADGAFEVLSPRTRVLASAYALNADTLDGRDSSFFATTSNAFLQGGNAFGTLATLGTTDGNALAFETSGAERVRIDSAGNVGIATAAPGARLDVRQEDNSISVGTQVANGWTDANGIIGFPGYNANHGEIAWYPDSDAFALIDSSLGGPGGDYGPLATIFANGAALPSLTNLYARNAFLSGNLGIGMTSPETRLHVGGSVRTDGYGAKTIYHRHMTAEWLNANATFPSARSRTLVGSRLDIGAGGALDKILEVPVLPAGALSGARTYSVAILVWSVDFTADNDLAVGVADGTDLVSFKRADAGNAVIGWIQEGTDTQPVGGLNTPATGGASGTTRKNFRVHISLGPTTRVLGSSEDTIEPAVAITTRVIDRTAALKVVLFADDAPETYGLYSVDVTVTEEGP